MPRPLIDHLYDPERACEFDPFQAVRLLELLANDPPAGGWREAEAAVRFRANVSLSFPPSLVAQILPPAAAAPDPADMRPVAAAVRWARETRRRRAMMQPERLPAWACKCLM